MRKRDAFDTLLEDLEALKPGDFLVSPLTSMGVLRRLLCTIVEQLRALQRADAAKGRIYNVILRKLYVLAPETFTDAEKPEEKVGSDGITPVS